MSSNIEINIHSTTETVSLTYNLIKIECVEYCLYQSAKFHVLFYSVGEGLGTKIIKNKYLIMEGKDFEQWGIDDDYVKDWVLSQLGLSAA